MRLVDKFVVIPAQDFAVLFSVDKIGLSNVTLVARRARCLKFFKENSLNYNEIQGCYTHENGCTVAEVSYIVDCHCPEVAKKIATFAGRWEQESVLIVNQMAQAHLVFPQENHSFITKHIGKYCEIPQEEIGLYDAYTIHWTGDKPRYFVVKE
jgi:hypothetical protein